MKKAISLICIAALICTLSLSAGANNAIPVGGGEGIEEDYPALLTDALDIMKHLAGLIELSQARIDELDFDDDGVITEEDAKLVFKALAEIAPLPQRNYTGGSTTEPDMGTEPEPGVNPEPNPGANPELNPEPPLPTEPEATTAPPAVE